MNIYQRINGADWRNIWVVGDLHGCYTNLMGKLDVLKFDPAQDLLISVGDIVDRGTENVECTELITMPWFRAVRGNHEQMMIDGLSEHGNVNHWLVNGGGWFFYLDYEKEVLAKALVHKAAELPLIIELVTGDRKVVICHADYPHNEYEFDKPVPEEMVIWNREDSQCARRISSRNHRRRHFHIWSHACTSATEILQPDVHRHWRCVLRKPDISTVARRGE